MTIEDLIASLEECDPDEQCYIRINGVFMKLMMCMALLMQIIM